MRARGWATLVVVAALVGAIAGAGAFSRGGQADARCRASCREAALQAHFDALVGVADRIYHEETSSETGKGNARRIAGDAALTRAIRRSDRRALRREALRQLFKKGKHVVRIRVFRGNRLLTDVGGQFVVPSAHAAIHLPGQDAIVELAMQDVLGYEKLVHRQTGLDMVARGAHGHVVSSQPALARARLPESGRVRVGRRDYLVRTLHFIAVGGEAVSATLLMRLG